MEAASSSAALGTALMECHCQGPQSVPRAGHQQSTNSTVRLLISEEQARVPCWFVVICVVIFDQIIPNVPCGVKRQVFYTTQTQ